MSALPHNRRVWAASLATLVATAGLAVALGQLIGPAGAQTAGTDLQRSAALRAAPAIGFAAPGRTFGSGGDARRASETNAKTVPLPRGGNFNGVRWEEAGAGLTDADVHAVQEYNAACQWLRALSDGRDAVVARTILAEVPGWPSLRGTDRSGLWAAAVAAFPKGDLAVRMLDDCRASHEREIAYARGLGLAPSS